MESISLINGLLLFGALLVMLGILVFGVMSYRLLPVSDLPNVDFPTIQVGAGLPGASPETMASAVALPVSAGVASVVRGLLAGLGAGWPVAGSAVLALQTLAWAVPALAVVSAMAIDNLLLFFKAA
jgi:hypothetical protein